MPPLLTPPVEPQTAIDIRYERKCLTLASGAAYCNCIGLCMSPLTPQEKKRALEEELAYLELELARARPE